MYAFVVTRTCGPIVVVNCRCTWIDRILAIAYRRFFRNFTRVSTCACPLRSRHADRRESKSAVTFNVLTFEYWVFSKVFLNQISPSVVIVRVNNNCFENRLRTRPIFIFTIFDVAVKITGFVVRFQSNPSM